MIYVQLPLVPSTQYCTFLLNLQKIGVRMALLPVIVFVMMLTVNNVKADDPPPPCDMDCLPEDPWNYGQLGPYPNPGTDWFNIKFNSDSEGSHTLEVFDASGNLITIQDFGKVQD